jgi:nucleotide-binding universal stress UspA family protein
MRHADREVASARGATRPDRPAHRVLVPVLGGDISEGALAQARSALASPDAHLALVHVVSSRPLAGGCPGGHPASEDVDLPRWQALAATVPPERLFVDAALGDPGEVILAAARRFGSDLIVLGPTGRTARAASTDRAITQVLHAATGRVLVVTDPDDRDAPSLIPGATTAAAPKRPDLSRRHHADPFRTSPRSVQPRGARLGTG